MRFLSSRSPTVNGLSSILMFDIFEVTETAGLRLDDVVSDIWMRLRSFAKTAAKENGRTQKGNDNHIIHIFNMSARALPSAVSLRRFVTLLYR